MWRRSTINQFSRLTFSCILIFYIYKNGAEAFKTKQTSLQEDSSNEETTELLKTLYPGLNIKIYPALAEVFENFEALRQNEQNLPRPHFSTGFKRRSVMKQNSNKNRRSDLVNADTMQEYGRVIKKRFDWLTEWKRQAASKPDVVEDLNLPGSWRIM